MLSDRSGLTMVEYIVGAGIVIALAGAAMYAIFQKLGTKLNEVNDRL